MQIVNQETHNGYTYNVYENGTKIARGTIQNQTAPRNNYNQSVVAKASGEPNMQGGHVIPASQNGTGDRINLSAQNAKVNMRDVRALEREETKAVRSGAEIQTERIAYHSGNPNCPDAFMINDTVTMNGKTSTVHRSYTNADMSEFYNNTKGLEDAPDSYDAAKNSGFSKEEFNNIMDKANNMNISDFDSGWRSSSNMENADLPGNGEINGYDLSSGNPLDSCYSDESSSSSDENSNAAADNDTVSASDEDSQGDIL